MTQGELNTWVDFAKIAFKAYLKVGLAEPRSAATLAAAADELLIRARQRAESDSADN